eukprot:SAG31_NODE_335_length_17509_cov_7.127972_15_plen_160_part_00
MLQPPQIMDVASERVFGASSAIVGERGQLPLLRDGSKGFGLLDVVRYNGSPQEASVDAKAMQVAEHGDPGLFALSVFSSTDGLELYDPATNSWISPPSGLGILWLGVAAEEVSGGRVKPGLHRVRQGLEQRQTIWYEVCTQDQTPDEVIDTGLHRCVSL